MNKNEQDKETSRSWNHESAKAMKIRTGAGAGEGPASMAALLSDSQCISQFIIDAAVVQPIGTNKKHPKDWWAFCATTGQGHITMQEEGSASVARTEIRKCLINPAGIT